MNILKHAFFVLPCLAMLASTAFSNDRAEYDQKYGYRDVAKDELDEALAKTDSSCAIEEMVATYQKKGDLAREVRAIKALVLFKTRDVKELLPGISSDDLNLLQRNLLRKYANKNPELNKSFEFVDMLKTSELAVGNYREYDKLFKQNQQNHAAKLKSDIGCYRFLHQAFVPSQKAAKQAMADLAGQHGRCQRSQAIAYFKAEAKKTFACLKASGRPFASYADFDQLYNAGSCK